MSEQGQSRGVEPETDEARVASEGADAVAGPTGARPSRRGFLVAGAGAAFLAGFSERLFAQVGWSAAATTSVDPNLWFLVDRVTNGWTPNEWAHALTLGYDGYLHEQLLATSSADPGLVPILSGLTTLPLTSKQLFDQYVATGQTSVVVNELQTAAVLRAVHSRAQLHERMVEFWTDHFNVDHADERVQYFKTTEDRDVIRRNALGNFRGLLVADAKSAAMLHYLDNYRNFATAPNENYGRELLELHTLGVGNYTEADVANVARCLTGWQYWGTTFANHGEFRFNAAQHDNGTKVVLGNTIAPGGVTDGERLMEILATHPATAQFLARKLCRWFLSYAPPQGVVDRVAATFLSSGGDLSSTVAQVLSRRSLEATTSTSQLKIKRPFHFVCSVVRATNPTLTQPVRLVAELATMGQQPFRWPAPNGYPDSAEAWGSVLLPRWNFVARYFGNSLAGVTVDVATIFAGVPKSGLAAHASRILTGDRLSAAEVAAVQAYADSFPTLNNALRREVLALSCSTPTFQTY